MKNRSILRSFKASFDGLQGAFRAERNFRIHCFLGALAVILGIIMGLNNTQWVLLILVIGLVLALEIINAAIEHTIDLIIATPHPKVKFIKDLMAAAVMIAALIALGLSLFILLPKIWTTLGL